MWLSSSHTVIRRFYSGAAPHLRGEHVPKVGKPRPDLPALVCPQLLELRNLGVVRKAEASIINRGHSEKRSKIKKTPKAAF